MGLTFAELGGWPGVLGRLFSREDLDAEEASAAFSEVLSGAASAAQVAAFAAALRTKGETAEELSGLVDAMRSRSLVVRVEGELVDTCGTGGDRSGSLNASTLAALVVAASGARVCKHGGRAASSQAGSADVLEALGVAVELGPAGVARCIEETGIGFCYAPRFHPAMRHAAPIRRQLGAPTTFNFLGPLANPGGARRQLVGVGDASMADKMLSVLEANGARHVMIVHGHDGLDELSISAVSSVLELRFDSAAGEVLRRRYDVDAVEAGLSRAPLEALRGGSPERNAALVRSVLAAEPGPLLDFALWNAAGGLVVAGVAADLAAGVESARELVSSGAAAAVLDRLIAVSRQAADDGLT
ncbi:MAG: anthranilate phosphoribosyltransferase [Acidimicrobiales bacterium]